jgi:hypothetical protein
MECRPGGTFNQPFDVFDANEVPADFDSVNLIEVWRATGGGAFAKDNTLSAIAVVDHLRFALYAGRFTTPQLGGTYFYDDLFFMCGAGTVSGVSDIRFRTPVAQLVPALPVTRALISSSPTPTKTVFTITPATGGAVLSADPTEYVNQSVYMSGTTAGKSPKASVLSCAPNGAGTLAVMTLKGAGFKTLPVGGETILIGGGA